MGSLHRKHVMVKHCLVTGVALATVTTAWPLFGHKQPEKHPEMDSVAVKLADQMTRSFMAMDQALNRAFRAPIMEADVWHLPDGQAVMTPLRSTGRNFFDTMFDDFFPRRVIEAIPSESVVRSQKEPRYINIGEK